MTRTLSNCASSECDLKLTAAVASRTHKPVKKFQRQSLLARFVFSLPMRTPPMKKPLRHGNYPPWWDF